MGMGRRAKPGLVFAIEAMINMGTVNIFFAVFVFSFRTAKSCRMPASQAGRHGFDPRLPLFKLSPYRPTGYPVSNRTPFVSRWSWFLSVARAPAGRCQLDVGTCLNRL